MTKRFPPLGNTVSGFKIIKNRIGEHLRFFLCAAFLPVSKEKCRFIYASDRTHFRFGLSPHRLVRRIRFHEEPLDVEFLHAADRTLIAEGDRISETEICVHAAL